MTDNTEVEYKEVAKNLVASSRKCVFTHTSIWEVYIYAWLWFALFQDSLISVTIV